MIERVKTAEIRELYLRFFTERGHLRLPSDSLVPSDPDPTLMFTSAGMVQFKPYFLGATPVFPGHEGVWRRATTAQKCLRIGDIENVGRTARHNSFFEMMGNFSFGDYFKKEAATWAWEFLTGKDWLGLDPERLYVTVYLDDDEAYRVWTEEVGLPPERVSRFGEDENFWPAEAPSKGPNGPCGPCSEIFYDRGPDFGGGEAETGPNTGTGDRFVEIWNLVFTQFDRQEGGKMDPLPQRNIDTGFGLYRVAPILQGKRDFYDTDLFAPLIEKVVELTGVPYQGASSVSHRVIAEHVRAVTFAITDGVTLSNTGPGYVIRKLLRRATRHAYLLGAREPLIYKLVPIVVATMRDAYPEVAAAEATVREAVEAEERQFLRTLGAGLNRLEDALASTGRGGTLSGETAFQLSDTFGFPLDLTLELAEERGVTVDRERYDALMGEQQERARGASKFKGEIFKEVAGALETVVREHGPTSFVGYDALNAPAQVLAILSGNSGVSEAREGEHVQVVLDRTPFYAEGGGQVGDTGLIEAPHGRLIVTGTRKTPQGVFLHVATVLRGSVSQGDTVEARVDPARLATQRHHTATHLLQAALRAVLGAGARQAGSLVAPDRLRFDFTHGEAMTSEQLAEVETLVNRFIQADFEVSKRVMPIEEARSTGATALFGEKYGDTVRVVTVEGPISTLGVTPEPAAVTSREFCGGCHVNRTGEIGAFIIASEEGTAAGVRRIEALAGEAAIAYARENLNRASKAAQLLVATPETLVERIERLQDDLKAARAEAGNLKAELVNARVGGSQAQAGTRELGGFKVAVLELPGVAGNELRLAGDNLLDKSGADLAVVASDTGLVVKASRDAVARGANAGKVLSTLAVAGGGRGGGRPDMAQGGIKDAKAALAALDSAF
ncbi:MAG TPA: alanine--tRNA ligase [Deinococcales bacterium]|nr:alanine--tRNA ligase [Deinococcales bacterium]